MEQGEKWEDKKWDADGNKTKIEVQRTLREMREQEMKHGGMPREEKKWNTERNKKHKVIETEEQTEKYR
jgi:hypothetical protein